MSQQRIVLLEGFHVVKHAIRFNADIVSLFSNDTETLGILIDRHAPDIREQLFGLVKEVDDDLFASFTDTAMRTPVVGRAHIPEQHIVAGSAGPIVLLENPRDLENIGAVVRLAAGMGARGVVVTGTVDPWHKNCLRGSQGLHFALPVVWYRELRDFFDDYKEPVYVFDGNGEALKTGLLSGNCIIAFGSERQGVSRELREVAQSVVSLPIREGVSSYNLATSVAMALYAYSVNT